MTAATTSKTWEISTSDFAADKWHFLEVSFHPERGLRLYEGGRLVAESNLPQQRDSPAPTSYDLDRFVQCLAIAFRHKHSLSGIVIDVSIVA